MDSTLDDKLAEGQIAKSLEEQFSNLVKLAREAGVGPLARPTRIKTSRAPPAKSAKHQRNTRSVAIAANEHAVLGPRWQDRLQQLLNLAR
jgi:hypothetical protein